MAHLDSTWRLGPTVVTAALLLGKETRVEGMAMADAEACGGGGLGHVNYVLVKQLASIHADGDNLSRRLHNLRAAAAAAAAPSVPRPPPQTASALADDKTDIISSTASVVRSPSSAARRKGQQGHGDSLNGDVLKLCSLTKMLTEENERLQALVCKMDTDLRQVRAQQAEESKSSAAESEARLKAAMQELDDAMGAMELLRCEKERLQQENARLLEENHNEHRELCSGSERSAREDDADADDDRSSSQGEGQPCCCALLCVSKSSKQKCLISEASRMLEGKHKLTQADDHAFVRTELRRLVRDFVQGLEEELAKRAASPAAADNGNEDQHGGRRPNVIKYALPAATILVAGVVTYFTAISKQKSS